MARKTNKLKHPKKFPLTILQKKNGEVKYVAHQQVTDIIRKAVKAVYPNMAKKTLSKYSCHSIRVWDCVSLDEVGKLPEFIRKR